MNTKVHKAYAEIMKTITQMRTLRSQIDGVQWIRVCQQWLPLNQMESTSQSVLLMSVWVMLSQWLKVLFCLCWSVRLPGKLESSEQTHLNRGKWKTSLVFPWKYVILANISASKHRFQSEESLESQLTYVITGLNNFYKLPSLFIHSRRNWGG